MKRKLELCCAHMRRAVGEDLIRVTDSYGHLHLTPTERGCSDPGISYCPFCGRAVRGELKEIQDRERRILAEHAAAHPEPVF